MRADLSKAGPPRARPMPRARASARQDFYRRGRAPARELFRLISVKARESCGPLDARRSRSLPRPTVIFDDEAGEMLDMRRLELKKNWQARVDKSNLASSWG